MVGQQNTVRLLTATGAELHKVGRADADAPNQLLDHTVLAVLGKDTCLGVRQRLAAQLLLAVAANPASEAPGGSGPHRNRQASCLRQLIILRTAIRGLHDIGYSDNDQRPWNVSVSQ
jgi:hypothetical protein